MLAQWVAATLLSQPDIKRDALLEAAMGRQYSAAREMFFTGGGLHDFVNFDAKDNSRVMDVWEATKNSVNLVYIRIMRDIVRHYASASPGAAARILDDASNPMRQTYLMRFVDQEGRLFIRRFYQNHKSQTPVQMAEDVYARVRANPRRFTSAYRYLEPQAGFDAYVTALHANVPASASLSPKTLKSLYETHAPDAYNLADRGYVTQIHPLELWVVKALRSAPGTDLKTLDDQGADARREVYNWLFKTSRKNAQDIRIQSLLEVEAFDGLLRDWKRLGYPFDNITPSYATAIGASGDRPAALAELMGILVNDGVRAPTVSLTGMHFAAHTPTTPACPASRLRASACCRSKWRKPFGAHWPRSSKAAPPGGWPAPSRTRPASPSPWAARPAQATTVSRPMARAASSSIRASSAAPPPSCSTWAIATSAH